MRIHAPLLPLAISMIVGIAMSQWTDDWLMPLAVLTIVVVVTCCVGRYPRLQTAGIIVGTLLLGMTLGSRQRQQLDVEWSEERQQVELIVTSEVKVKKKTVVLDALTADGQHKLRCSIQRDQDSEQIQIGQGILVDSRIKKVHDYHHGHFDYLQYMQCHGFTGELYAYSNQWQWQTISLKELSTTDKLRLRFLTWRHQLLKHFRQQHLNEESLGVILSLTLGDRSNLKKEVKDIYANVGAVHILALSGMHLMVIYSILSFLIVWRRWRIASQVIIILALWAFAILTGLSPSVTRSALMISLYALLSTGYRQQMPVNTLAFCAIFMLIINPYSLYDIGFQLSFMAVLSILLINPLIQYIIPAHIQQEHSILRAIWGVTTLTIAAQIGTFPLVLYHFGRFCPWFLLSNYIVVPLATITLYIALISIVVSWWPWALTLTAKALETITLTMNRALECVAELPLGTIEGINLSVVQVYLIYIIIGSIYVAISLRYPATRRSG